jgi:hypothetical protein
MTTYALGSKLCPLECEVHLQSLRDYQRCIEASTLPRNGDRVIVGVLRPLQLSAAYQRAVDAMAAAQFAVIAEYGVREPRSPGSPAVEKATIDPSRSGIDPMLHAGIIDTSLALGWPPEVSTFDEAGTRRPRFKFGDRVTELEYEALRAVITSFEIHLANWRHEAPPTPSSLGLPQAEHEIEPAVNELRGEGAAWSICFAGQRAVVKNLKGMPMLAMLVREQGKVVHVARLDTSGLANMGGDDLLDKKGIESLRSRARSLECQRADRTAEGDDAGAAQLSAEIAQVERSLRSALGLGVHPRKLGSEFDAARDRVGRNLRTAINHIRAVHPLAAEHFDSAILDRHGASPRYAPSQHVDWKLT